MFGRYFGARYYGQRFFGKRGLVVDGAYNGSHYFGLRYFGVRYFGTSYQNSPAPLTATNTPALSGVLGVAGSLTFGSDFAVTQTSSLGLAGLLSPSCPGFSFESEVFYFTPPLSVSGLAGALTVAGNITISAPAPGLGGYFGRRYFGGRYYGPRYFGTAASWPLTLTAGVGLTGGLNVAGGISTTLGITPTNTLGLTASLSVVGDAGAEGGTDLADIHPIGSRKRRRDRVPNQARVTDRHSGVHRHDSYYAWVQSTLMQLAAAGVFDA